MLSKELCKNQEGKKRLASILILASYEELAAEPEGPDKRRLGPISVFFIRDWPAIRSLGEVWCREVESNHRHCALQAHALPLSYLGKNAK